MTKLNVIGGMVRSRHFPSLDLDFLRHQLMTLDKRSRLTFDRWKQFKKHETHSL
jgi:hypothetical protein